MCLTIPAKVLSIEESDSPVLRITVESAGKIKPLNAIMLDDLKVGDWVLYTSGNAVRKLSEEDAAEILELLEPKSHIDTGKLDDGFIRSVENLSGNDYKKEDIIRLLKSDDPVEMEALFAEAHRILKPGACFHILDFYAPQSAWLTPLLRPLAHFEHLDDNLNKRLPAMLTAAGFVHVEVVWRTLNGLLTVFAARA